MTRKILFAAAGLAGLAVAGAALADTLMQPGYYETRTIVDGETEVLHDCVTAKQNRTIETELKSALQDPSCKYAQRAIGGGKFTVSGTCSGQGVKSTFRQTGTYTPTGFALTMTSSFVIGGEKVNLNLKSTSRRISATCPKAR